MQIQHECTCSHVPQSITSKNYAVYEDSDWTACKKQPVPFSYFNKFTKKYSQFFDHHLLYCQQNPNCICYWSYISKIACQISNIVYDDMHALFQTDSLSDLLYKESEPSLEDTQNWDMAKNELVLRTLQNYFVFSFFYSNYHTTIVDLCSHVDANSLTPSQDLQKLYYTLSTIRPLFLTLYTNCLETHPHPKI